MLKSAFALALIALSLCDTAGAKARRGERRPRENKIFAAKPWSVSLENEMADEVGAFRFFTQSQVDSAALSGKLVALYNHTQYTIAPKLPINRRYALPATVSFLDVFAVEFYRQFHRPLMVDSAVRPATMQRSLLRRNSSAAPAYGERASSHERGTTLDISKHLTKAQQRWMVTRLLYHYALGCILVIQERGCFHIFVQGGVSRD